MKDPSCLFCAEDINGTHLEVYPRPDATVYICGLGGSQHIEADEINKTDPADVVADLSRVVAARKSLEGISKILPSGDGSAVFQACLRPCPSDAQPLIGWVPTYEGTVAVATGHNCW